MRFRRPFRILVIVSFLAWAAMIVTYVALMNGHTPTPEAPSATLALLASVVITTTLAALALRMVPSAVAAWTLGYLEGQEDRREQAPHRATLLRLVNDD